MAKPSGGQRFIEYRPLDDIIPASVNPKGHIQEAIEQSIERFGYTLPMELDERTGQLVGGHGRLQALVDMRLAGQEPPDGITEDWQAPLIRGWASANDEEALAYLLATNQLTIAGGWDEAELVDALERINELEGTGFDADDLAELQAIRDLELEDDAGHAYSPVINVPHYDPVGPIPEVSELFDTSRTDALVAQIDQTAGLSPELAAYLKLAAQRHTVFNYRKAAEFYPYALPEIKQLMEESALVIIDLNDAIRLGFTRLETTLDELRAEDEIES